MPKRLPTKQLMSHEIQLTEVHVKLDTLTKMVSDHVAESKLIRDEIIEHRNNIVWHKRWLNAVSLGVVTLASWMFKKSFFGN